MRRLSLRTKFVLLITAVLTVIFGLIAYFLVGNVRAGLTNDLNRESKAFATLATKPIGDTYTLYKDAGSYRIHQEMQQYASLDSNVANISIVDTTGKTLFGFAQQPAAGVTPEVAAGFDPAYRVAGSGEITQVVEPYIDDFGFHRYSVAYSISTVAMLQAIHRQELAVLIFAILGLFISALATYEFINQFFLRPIEDVSRLAQVIAGGHYEQQIRSTRRDEIGALADSVNHMAEALKADIAKLQDVDRLKSEFIMITSHNLRTPLTIINGNLSLLETARLSRDVRQMLDSVGASARRLAIFSEQMLTIANIESGQQIGGFQKVPAADMADRLKKEFTSIAAEKGVKFTSQAAEGVEVVANEQQLTGALRNLLDNAFKFTPAGGYVDFSLRAEGGDLVVEVRDSGTGITPEELPKLFTKFHRGTSTLTYNYEGTGIGLYVVKLIAEQHGGAVQADSTSGQGAFFRLRVPLAGPAGSQPAEALKKPSETTMVR